MNHSRSAVLKAAADSAEFKVEVHTSSFVLMEHFGYRWRNVDHNGFAFWVNVLNVEQTRPPGNYRGMVYSFITSAEYQQRFSQIVTHSNTDCGR